MLLFNSDYNKVSSCTVNNSKAKKEFYKDISQETDNILRISRILDINSQLLNMTTKSQINIFNTINNNININLGINKLFGTTVSVLIGYINQNISEFTTDNNSELTDLYNQLSSLKKPELTEKDKVDLEYNSQKMSIRMKDKWKSYKEQVKLIYDKINKYKETSYLELHISQLKLSRILNINQSTLSNKFKLLEKYGFIEKISKDKEITTFKYFKYKLDRIADTLFIISEIDRRFEDNTIQEWLRHKWSYNEKLFYNNILRILGFNTSNVRELTRANYKKIISQYNSLFNILLSKYDFFENLLETYNEFDNQLKKELELVEKEKNNSQEIQIQKVKQEFGVQSLISKHADINNHWHLKIFLQASKILNDNIFKDIDIINNGGKIIALYGSTPIQGINWNTVIDKMSDYNNIINNISQQKKITSINDKQIQNIKKKLNNTVFKYMQISETEINNFSKNNKKLDDGILYNKLEKSFNDRVENYLINNELKLTSNYTRQNIIKLLQNVRQHCFNWFSNYGFSNQNGTLNPINIY